MPLLKKLAARKAATDKATKSLEKKSNKKREKLKPCPPGHKRVNGKCVQKGVGPEYKP
jgi:hypothetical protein